MAEPSKEQIAEARRLLAAGGLTDGTRQRLEAFVGKYGPVVSLQGTPATEVAETALAEDGDDAPAGVRAIRKEREMLRRAAERRQARPKPPSSVLVRGEDDGERVFPNYYFEPPRGDDEDDDAYRQRSDAAWGEQVEKVKAEGGRADRAKDSFAGQVAGALVSAVRGVDDAFFGAPLSMASAIAPETVDNVRAIAETHPVSRAVGAGVVALAPGGPLAQMEGFARGAFPAAQGATRLGQAGREATMALGLGAGHQAVTEGIDATERMARGRPQHEGALGRVGLAGAMGFGLGGLTSLVGSGRQLARERLREKIPDVGLAEGAGAHTTKWGGLQPGPEIQRLQTAGAQQRFPAKDIAAEEFAQPAAREVAERLAGARQGLDAAASEVMGATAGMEQGLERGTRQFTRRAMEELEHTRTGLKKMWSAEKEAILASPEARNPAPATPVVDKLRSYVKMDTLDDGQFMPRSPAPGHQRDMARLREPSISIEQAASDVDPAFAMGATARARPDTVRMTMKEAEETFGEEGLKGLLEQVVDDKFVTDAGGVITFDPGTMLTARQVERMIDIFDSLGKVADAPTHKTAAFQGVAATLRGMRRQHWPELDAAAAAQHQRISQVEQWMEGYGASPTAKRIDPDDLTQAEPSKRAIEAGFKDPLPGGPEEAVTRRATQDSFLEGRPELRREAQGLRQATADVDELHSIAGLQQALGSTAGQRAPAREKIIEAIFEGDARYDAMARALKDNPRAVRALQEARKQATQVDTLLASTGLTKDIMRTPAAAQGILQRLADAGRDYRQPGKMQQSKALAGQFGPEHVERLERIPGVEAFRRLSRTADPTPRAVVSQGRVGLWMGNLRDFVRYRLDALNRDISRLTEAGARTVLPGAAGSLAFSRAAFTSEDLDAITDRVVGMAEGVIDAPGDAVESAGRRWHRTAPEPVIQKVVVEGRDE